MKTFRSFASFATHLQLLAIETKLVKHAVLEAAAEEVQETAKGMIGFYHSDPHWEALSPEYEAQKVRDGFEADAPLLRTGEMRESIKYVVTTDGHAAVIGSDDQKMVWHELGTSRMPPRPVMGPAGIHSAPRVALTASKMITEWLSGRGVKKPVVHKNTDGVTR
jgi:phage gpG-like protein